ncbi:MAG TPA: hypothetical protein VGJ28_02035 [Micromonosporaceae bacterium]|jgi:hypothetical protein
MSQIENLNPLNGRRREYRPVGVRTLALSIVVVLLSGFAAWGVSLLTGQIVSRFEVSVADHRGHRPARPPVPTSPFVR